MQKKAHNDHQINLFGAHHSTFEAEYDEQGEHSAKEGLTEEIIDDPDWNLTAMGGSQK